MTVDFNIPVEGSNDSINPRRLHKAGNHLHVMRGAWCDTSTDGESQLVR
jgi:hypothetical protein